MKKTLKGRLVTAAAAAAFLTMAGAAGAAVLWNGTADYSQATASGDIVGPFNTYDFSLGPVLLKGAGAAQVGGVYDGFYQSYLTRHLNNGIDAPSPNLSASGAGAGYEITAVGNFQSLITAISPTNGVQFTTLPGGSFELWASAPNYSFGGDSGFADGTKILTGSVVGGGGSFIPLAAGGFGFGAGFLSVQVTDTAPGVFVPPTVIGSDTIFTLQLLPTDLPLLGSISSVQGNAVAADDLLVLADGNAGLTAVPIPTAAVLLGSGLIGLIAVRTRRNNRGD